MTNTNITNFRRDIYELVKQAVRYNEPINISTKEGNAVLLSEADYNSLMETLYIESIPGLKADIIKGMSEPIEECLNEDEVKW